MKKLIALAVLGAFAVGASPAFAAEHSQQTRMKECNVKAKGKKGDERRHFMSACLSGKDVAKDAANDAAKDAPVKKVSMQKKS
jgi:psiF repeat